MTQTQFDFAGRVARARSAMEAHDADVLLLSFGADLPYVIGYDSMDTERITLLILPVAGEATLLIPRFEAPRVGLHPGVFTVLPWDETDDPMAMAADVAGSPASALVGDRMRSSFLLGLQERMPGTAFSVATGLMKELRIRKDPGEITLLRAAAEAVDRVVVRLDATRFSGLTETELSRVVGAMTIEEGCDVAAFAIIASGPNGASPHHHPGERLIERGDMVVVDFGGPVGGYQSDTTRTFCVGDPDPRAAEAFTVLHEAHQAAVAAAAPGVAAESVDRAARRVITEAGWGEYFIHRTGHGIGLEVHEHPYIVEGNSEPLDVGMAFSIEPGIYVPGEFGMRIEDIVVVTAEGADRLNRSERNLHVVE